MSIKRISDLSSILNEGGPGPEQHVISIEEGVKRDVVPEGVGSETQQLKKSIFETSWPVENSETPTRYNSKNMTFETLSSYVLHNTMREDCTFSGVKTITTIDGKQGGLNVYGPVNISGDVFNVASRNVTISGEYTNIYGDKELNLSVVNGGPDSHIDIINQNNVTLSSNNLVMVGLSTSLIYEDRFTVFFRDSNKNLIPVLTFGHAGDTPTVEFNQSSVGNPISGTINHSLWS